MKFYLFSNYDCVIKSEDSLLIRLFKGEQKEIEADNLQYLELHPLHSQNQIMPCFCVLEKVGSGIKTLAENVKVYNINKNNAVLEFNPSYVTTFQSLANLSTATADYEVCQEDMVYIKCAGKVIYASSMPCQTADLYEGGDLVFCVIKGFGDKHLVVLDGQNNILVDEAISQIENTSSGFSTFLNLNDMQKQGIVKKYSTTNGEFKKESEYPVYVNQTAKSIYSKALNGHAFFEAVRARNMNLARTYLSTELSSKVTLNHLVSYFGEFNKIFCVSISSSSPCFALSSSRNNMCKVFKLDIVDNLIDNIEQL